MNFERRTGRPRVARRCSAVLTLALKIRINSSVSCSIGSTCDAGSNKGTRLIRRSQRCDSRNSFKQTLNLRMKSSTDSASCASPWFGRGEVPLRNSCQATCDPAGVRGRRSVILIISAAYSNNRSSRSYFLGCSFDVGRSAFMVQRSSVQAVRAGLAFSYNLKTFPSGSSNSASQKPYSARGS